ncbi:MAG: hypothetical protein NC434_14560 [Ruminococcus sp.]|nr:hypothetical protein [Ruminococcus sp.]MCM1155729.1 hypothetical protein [Roseburia sp.]
MENGYLTTIKQSAEDMARQTIRLMFDIIAGKESHKQIVFEAQLRERIYGKIAYEKVFRLKLEL